MDNKSQSSHLENLFFKDSNLDSVKVDRVVSDSLKNADDGELYLQFEESENFVFDDQRLKSASFDVSKGFGLRAISEDTTGYAHSSDINEEALKKASETVSFVTKKNNNSFNHNFSKTNKKLYENTNPIDTTQFDLKVNTLKQIDEYARKQNPNVKQVSASLNGS